MVLPPELSDGFWMRCLTFGKRKTTDLLRIKNVEWFFLRNFLMGFGSDVLRLVNSSALKNVKSTKFGRVTGCVPLVVCFGGHAGFDGGSTEIYAE